MAKLIFYDKDHQYEVDGENVPSVSEILRFMSREVYDDLPQFRVENAGQRGTNIHKACENLDRFGDVEIGIDIEPYLRAYIDFLDNNNVVWSGIEKALHSDNLMFAGTIDRIGVINGKSCIVDLKSNSAIKKPLVAAQLYGYKLLAEENGFKIDTMYCLWLKKDGTHKLIELNEGENLWQSCYTLHQALKVKKRKSKVISEEVEEEN